MQCSDPRIQSLCSQVYILGGSPCSGKSTIGQRLSARFDLHYYAVDSRYWEQVERCTPDRHPTMHRISTMGWNEIWSRPIPVMVQDELEFYREMFEAIVQDLLQVESGKPILAEGAALLPELVAECGPAECGIDRQRALYLVPTMEFQVHHYKQREFIHGILEECENPEQAFGNWMMRDHLFGKQILRQAESKGFGTLLVDGERSLEDLLEHASRHFGLG